MKVTKLQKIGIAILAAALTASLFAGCAAPDKTEPTAPAAETVECVDGQCQIPGRADGSEVYAIVSPVGYHNVDMVEQAPRLDTLEGKTLALVGGSFMASVTHNELKKCIQEEFPTAKIYMFQEVGFGGPYSVFGQSQQTKRFQQKLQDLGVDAVISGNCGCGLCTTKESGSSIAAEYIGIPTVTVGAPTFIAQIHSTGVNRGVGVLRTAEYPGAFASHSEEQLVKNAREILWPQIKEALTAPITQTEIDEYASAGERPYDEIVYYGNYDEIQDFCQVNDWTDGLPVVPPTDERVRDYLRFTPYAAEDELGTFPLAYRKCLVYTVAANAVMAGVPKEFMPLCIAFTKCLEDGEWRRPLASTHGWTPYAWLNGPLARQLGIDHEQGMISEETNRALGRFIELAMRNLGGYYVKENRMGTFGYLTPWTFSEDEEACLRVGWQPYHVTQGYDLNTNTLTAASALEWGNNVTPATDDPQQIMTLLAWDITEKQQNGLGNTNPQVYRTVFITEDVAQDLARKYTSKEALELALIDKARRPLWLRVYANYWANTGSQQFTERTIDEHYQKLLNDPAELAAMTETPEWLKGMVQDSQIMTMGTMVKGQTPMLICGDGVRNKFQVMPGGGYVTQEIALPENWDSLVAELGYEPLSHFYLDSEALPVESEPVEEVPELQIQGTSTIAVPDVLADGFYRLLTSARQMNGAGKVMYNGGTMTYWDTAANASATLNLNGIPELAGFMKLLSSLGNNCSFKVENGMVTALIARPSTSTKRSTTDLSRLTAEDLSGIAVSLEAVTQMSKDGGGASASGTTVIFSGSLDRLTVDLGGTLVADAQNPDDFVTLNGSWVSLNPEAPIGVSAKLGVQISESQYRTFTFSKPSSERISILYRDSNTLNPQ